ncbi:MAG TPA: YwqG family protein [Longimicrobium sp.]
MDREEREKLEDLIREHGLWEHREIIVAAARPTILVGLGDEGEGPVGHSRVGGVPDMPDALPWPVEAESGEPLCFLLQVNFGELMALPGNPLPAAGMLYLFAGENRDDARQVVVHLGREPLRPRHPAPGTECVTDGYAGLAPHRLVFRLAADVPRWATSDFVALCDRLGGDGDDDRLHDLGNATAEGTVGKLLGHASGLGDDPREDAYVVREVNADWLYDSERRGTLDLSRAARWHNLLEVESIREVGLRFDDAGYLQVLVHEDDLRRRDFSRVYVNVQST